MIKEMKILSEEQVNTKFTKLKKDIKRLKEKQTKLSKHQKKIEDRTKG